MSRSQSQSGLSLVEIAIAVALLGLVAAAGIATLISLNKNAAVTRMMINAKEVVQRNIEVATAAPFTSGNVPAVLQFTSESGSAWDDDGGGDNSVTVQSTRDNTRTVNGTLLRIVQPETNAVGADIRRVTFRLSYSVYGRNQSYEVTTLRAPDR